MEYERNLIMHLLVQDWLFFWIFLFLYQEKSPNQLKRLLSFKLFYNVSIVIFT
jgi:hypothetical protein